MHTIDPKMLMAWADVLAFGAQKYHQRNFLKEPGMAWSRVYDSLNRHLWAFWDGEWLDPESGLPHLAHVMCNLQFLWTYHERASYHVGDDRPSSVEFEGAQYKDWEARFKAASTPSDRPVPDIFASLGRSPGKAVDVPGHYGSMRGKVCAVVARNDNAIRALARCSGRNATDVVRDEVKRGSARLVEETSARRIKLYEGEVVMLRNICIPLKGE